MLAHEANPDRTPPTPSWRGTPRRLPLLLVALLLAAPAGAAIDIQIDVLPELAESQGGTEANRCNDPTDVCPPPTNVILSATRTTCTQGECTDPFRDLIYRWDFGDPAAGSWATDGKSKNEDFGPFVSHVYETAGTHTVTLTVTDPSGALHEATTTVYITDPNVAWPAAVTTCATNSSSADVDFSWCPYACETGVTCVCTNSSDPECDVKNSGDEFTGMVNSQIAAGKKRILIKGGETWTMTRNDMIRALGVGPGLIASAGGAAAPVNWDIDVSGNCFTPQTLWLFDSNVGDSGNWRFADINVDFVRVDAYSSGAQAGNVYTCSGQGCYNNFLWLRGKVNDACTFYESQHDWGNRTPPYSVSGGSGAGVGSHIFFVGDDTLFDSSAEHGSCVIGGRGDGVCGYGFYIASRYVVIQGIQFGSELDGAETRWTRSRLSASDGVTNDEGNSGYYVIQHNQFEDVLNTALDFRSHLNSMHEYFNISDNYFATAADNNISFNNTYNARPSGPGLQYALVERNVFNGDVEESSISRHLTIRNNVFGPNGNFFLECRNGGQGKDGWADDYLFVNNSFYGTNRTDGFRDLTCAGVPEYDPDIVCRNNVLWDTSATSTARACNLPTRWLASPDAYSDNASRSGADAVTLTQCPFQGKTGSCDEFDYQEPSHWLPNAAPSGGSLLQDAGTPSVRVVNDFVSSQRVDPDIGALELAGEPPEYAETSNPDPPPASPDPGPAPTLAAPVLLD